MLFDPAVLVGCGRVRGLVADGLLRGGRELLVIKAEDAIVQPLRDRGAEVLPGNAADPALLASANLAEARLLLVAIPDAFAAGQIVQQARAANPDGGARDRASHAQAHGPRRCSR